MLLKAFLTCCALNTKSNIHLKNHSFDAPTGFVMKKLSSICICVILFVACKKTPVNTNNGGNNVDTTQQPLPQLYQYNVLPSSTDPGINAFNNEHYINFDTRAVAKNKLFVFLPGTTGFPSVYKLIVNKAASLGYHAIGLMYPNNSDLYVASATGTDLTQFGKCRQEIFDGSDQTTGVSVDPANCIKNRLYKLLVLLQQQHPTQNWQQFISGNEVNWSKLIIAGHSQGGGHALYISKKVSVERAISFASIDWNNTMSQSASWVFESGSTPISKCYSFNSTRDQIFSYANVVTQLADMGFTGPAVSIDNFTAPYSNSHTLTTSATPAISVLVPDHNITCLDSYIPKTNTGAVISSIDRAWAYLMGE